MWETEAACPITDTDTEGRNCSIKDRNSEYTFDLSPLRQRGDQDYYEVSGTGGDKIRVYTVLYFNQNHQSSSVLNIKDGKFVYLI